MKRGPKKHNKMRGWPKGKKRGPKKDMLNPSPERAAIEPTVKDMAKPDAHGWMRVPHKKVKKAKHRIPRRFVPINPKPARLIDFVEDFMRASRSPKTFITITEENKILRRLLGEAMSEFWLRFEIEKGK